ncbi:Tyrosine-protein kinase Src42A [Chionoecetes opilio]|uniref:non-specific protein-tyrosine kinase n=1 Tax=Chionoecetes opilio TaxID=41210 RepID=A0A8J4YKQ9_CHIOP|nr:Tyrosine-protein kinase Src42A [Chionoecetes opilio]
MALSWLWRKLKGDEDQIPPSHRRPSHVGRTQSMPAEAPWSRSASVVSETHGLATLPSPAPGRPCTRQNSRSDSLSTQDTPWGTPCETLTVGQTVVALNDYVGRTDEDLSFRRGEPLEVVKETSEGWWYARSQVTGLSGYIPVSYIARLKSIEAEPWYFGDITRGQSERRLLASANDHGSFLIRNSESRKDEYSLSVRDMAKVQHYRIRPKDHGGFFIKRRDTFPSLHDLVDFYIRDAHGLCTRLNRPCVKVELMGSMWVFLGHSTLQEDFKWILVLIGVRTRVNENATRRG